MSERKFIAATAKGGRVRLLFGDGDEPSKDVADALLALGVEPESVAALQAHTALAKARRAERIEQAIEKLRAIPGADDDFVLGVLDGSVIGFAGRKGLQVFKAAARHPATGQFVKAPLPLFTAHGGNVLPVLARAQAESRRGHPVFEVSDVQSPTAYDSTGANPMGNAHPASSPI